MIVCWGSLPYWCIWWLFYLYLFSYPSFWRLISNEWVFFVRNGV